MRLSLFINDMIMFRENPKESLKNILLDLISSFNKITKQLLVCKNKLYLYTLTTNNCDEDMK